MLGWKLHGLIEHGANNWRPKDLYDLLLYTTQVTFDDLLLPEAIYVAFTSRNSPIQEVVDLLCASEWWDSEANYRKWQQYIKSEPSQPIPENLKEVVTIVREHWLAMLTILAN
jgi:Ni,Fe-hydrogenase I cytochrome b subunit